MGYFLLLKMDDSFTESLCFDNRTEGEGGALGWRSPIVCAGQSAARAKKDGKERGQGPYRGRDPEGPGKVGARVRPGLCP